MLKVIILEEVIFNCANSSTQAMIKFIYNSSRYVLSYEFDERGLPKSVNNLFGKKHYELLSILGV